MKKLVSLLLVASMSLMMLVGCGSTPAADQGTNPDATDVTNDAEPEAPKKVGFVTFSTDGDFFQALADCFVSVMESEGWEAYYENGEFNPEKQINAFQNYVAMDMDVILVWAVAPEAMSGVIDEAMAKGIKVVAFVAPTEKYDALMVSDDAELADNAAKLAAKWIDETYADAEDGSVPVAVFTERDANTGVIQGDELLKIQDFSKKAAAPKEVACSAETMEEGQKKAENLYTSNPEIKVFLTAHNAIAVGINNYYTSLSSPVTDYSDMAIFAINGDDASAELIAKSIDGETPFRGMVLTGSVMDTANEIRDVVLGVTGGTLETGYVQKAATVFVFGDTVGEYAETGTVKSFTADDLK